MPSGQGDPFGGGNGLQSPKFVPFCRKKWRVKSGKVKPFFLLDKLAKNAQKNNGPQNRLYRNIYIYICMPMTSFGGLF